MAKKKEPSRGLKNKDLKRPKVGTPARPTAKAVEVNVKAARNRAWNRQPGETPWAYRLFVEFKGLGPARTIVQLADIEVEGKKTSVTSLRTMSMRYNWPRRAALYDQTIIVKANVRLAAELRNMHARHARAATQAHRIVVTLYNEFNRRMNAEPASLQLMSIGKFLQHLTRMMGMLEKISKVERLARGEASEVVTVKGDGGTSNERSSEMMAMIRNDSEALELWSQLQHRLDKLRRIEKGEEEGEAQA